MVEKLSQSWYYFFKLVSFYKDKVMNFNFLKYKIDLFNYH